MARVTYTSGGQARTAVLEGNLVVVGRDPACTLRLDAPDVSPIHCELRHGPEGWRIVDLESRAGSRVNGEFVNTRVLRDGDVIDAGGVELRFEGDAGTAQRSGASPAASMSSRPAAPQRAAAPVSGRSQRAAASATSRRDPDQPEREPRRGGRAARGADKSATGLLMVAGGIAMLFVVWFVMRTAGSETPNYRIRVQMDDADKHLQWQRVLDLYTQASQDGSNDAQEMEKIAARARKNLEGEATGGRIEKANDDWSRVGYWRQDHRKDDEEYLAKIDGFLNQYADLESESIRLARAERVKLTGTSATGGAPAGAGGAWKVALDDVKALETDGRFGAAIAKVDAYWAAHRDESPTMITSVEAEKDRLTKAAERWFAKQVALAAHYLDNGEKGKARRTLEAAANKIELPGYADRASEELTRLQSK